MAIGVLQSSLEWNDERVFSTGRVASVHVKHLLFSCEIKHACNINRKGCVGQQSEALAKQTNTTKG